MKAGDIIAERFRLEFELGAGGLGVVWAATVLDLDRSVAIKFLKSPNRCGIRRFEAEARALARLQHPGCVTMIEFGRTDGVPFIVMERVDGESLEHRRGQRIDVATTVDYLEQLLKVLHFAHERRVAHRDLKPSNVMLTDGRLKVLDFGLAKITGLDSADLTKTGEVFGTPVYMSPEQLRGSRDAGPPSDIYALGVMAFELLMGHPPYQGSSMLELAMGHLGETPPEIQRDDCPVALKRLIADMLAKEPARRPNASQALARLNPDSTPIPAETNAPLGLAIGLIAVVAVLLGVVTMLVLSDDEPTEGRVLPPRIPTVNTPKPTPTEVPVAAGCPAPRPGFGKVTPGLGSPWLYYAPEKGAGTPRPVVVVYQTEWVFPEQMVRGSGLADRADADGFLLLAVEGTVKREPDILLNTFDALDDLDAESCIDRERIYVIGHGSGGATSLRFACAPEVAAIATMAYNPNADRAFDCTAANPVAAMHIAPRDSGHAPLAGRSACRRFPAMPVADFERAWRERNACGKASSVSREDHGRCEEWIDCQAPFTACRVDGGHDWPGVPSNDPLPECVGPPTKFAVTDRVVDFLLQQRRN